MVPLLAVLIAIMAGRANTSLLVAIQGAIGQGQLCFPSMVLAAYCFTGIKTASGNWSSIVLLIVIIVLAIAIYSCGSSWKYQQPTNYVYANIVVIGGSISLFLLAIIMGLTLLPIET